MCEQMKGTLSENIRKIRNADSENEVRTILKEILRSATLLPLRLPDWMKLDLRREYESLELLLAGLSNIIKMLYNDEKAMTVVFTPDLLVSRLGFESVGQEVKSILFSVSRREPEIDSETEVIFVPVVHDLPQIPFASSCKIILLSPGKYNSIQLKWIDKCICGDAGALTLNPESMSDIHMSIRKNDKNTLEFLSARWEIENKPEGKEKLLKDILENLTAMVEWM